MLVEKIENFDHGFEVVGYGHLEADLGRENNLEEVTPASGHNRCRKTKRYDLG